jgi:hypothetical protein
MGTSDHVEPHHCYFGILALEYLLRETHSFHQLGETKIGAQGSEQEVGLEARWTQITLLVGNIEPRERAFFVSQTGTKGSDLARESIPCACTQCRYRSREISYSVAGLLQICN